jgi:hypothetical protein
LTSPNFATPTTENGAASPRVLMRTRSPSARLSFSAVSASTTTSLGPAAQRPSCSRNGVTRSNPAVRASRPTPKYGPSPSGLPSPPMILAFWSVTSPTATSTPPTRRTRSSSAAGTVGFCAAQSFVPMLNAVFAETTASVPS